jgi:hypothetical protein
MSAEEFMDWVAYEMLKDTEYREKWEKQIALELSSQKTAEERADDIRRLFAEIGASNGFNK